jgi:hypothetical protein
LSLALGRLRAPIPALILLLLVPGILQGQRHCDRYDPAFRKYSKRYFGAAFDWRMFNAEGMAESNLDPGATSWAGAHGIMQLTRPRDCRIGTPPRPRFEPNEFSHRVCHRDLEGGGN